MDTFDEAIQTALNDPAPYPALRLAAQKILDADGADVAYARLEVLRKRLEEEGDEDKESVVINVMDCLWRAGPSRTVWPNK